MYLDRKLSDHTLLQAICRTNRVDNEEKDLLLDSINDNKESERTREEQQHGKVVKKMKVSFASVVRQGSK